MANGQVTFLSDLFIYFFAMKLLPVLYKKREVVSQSGKLYSAVTRYKSLSLMSDFTIFNYERLKRNSGEVNRGSLD